jgi:hypothetical protein
VAFALRVLEIGDVLPRSTKGRNSADQLCRSGIGGCEFLRGVPGEKSCRFHPHAGHRGGGSRRDVFWLDLIVRSKILLEARLAPLIAEANEMLFLVIASINTAKRNRP